MKKLNIKKEELEMMNYNDIAYAILENSNKKMKIAALFLEVCKILELDEDKYQDHISDFFGLLSTDKRFIMLDDGNWDLKDKHNKGLVMDEDKEDEDEDEDEDLDDDLEDDLIDEDFLSDDDSEDDDLKDLVIIEDEEEL